MMEAVLLYALAGLIWVWLWEGEIWKFVVEDQKSSDPLGLRGNYLFICLAVWVLWPITMLVCIKDFIGRDQ